MRMGRALRRVGRLRRIPSGLRQVPSKLRRPGLAFWLATWFGSGLLPGMPGTWGSLAALPFAWILASIGGPLLVVAAAVAVFAVGLWASSKYMEAVKVHDPGPVVIDEVAAQWLTLAFMPLDPLVYALGFVFFRIADVAKPWPVNWLDRRVGGAIGVMIDDIVAALYAGVALWLVVAWL